MAAPTLHAARGPSGGRHTQITIGAERMPNGQVAQYDEAGNLIHSFDPAGRPRIQDPNTGKLTVSPFKNVGATPPASPQQNVGAVTPPLVSPPASVDRGYVPPAGVAQNVPGSNGVLDATARALGSQPAAQVTTAAPATGQPNTPGSTNTVAVKPQVQGFIPPPGVAAMNAFNNRDRSGERGDVGIHGGSGAGQQTMVPSGDPGTVIPDKAAPNMLRYTQLLTQKLPPNPGYASPDYPAYAALIKQHTADLMAAQKSGEMAHAEPDTSQSNPTADRINTPPSAQDYTKAGGSVRSAADVANEKAGLSMTDSNLNPLLPRSSAPPVTVAPGVTAAAPVMPTPPVKPLAIAPGVTAPAPQPAVQVGSVSVGGTPPTTAPVVQPMNNAPVQPGQTGSGAAPAPSFMAPKKPEDEEGAIPPPPPALNLTPPATASWMK